MLDKHSNKHQSSEFNPEVYIESEYHFVYNRLYIIPDIDKIYKMVGVNKQPSADDATYLRKIRKPLVEKKRRERMNQSITQLRALIDDTIKQNVAPMTRVDKADILELAVCHLTRMRQKPQCVSMATDDRTSYASGFQDCMRQVTSFLMSNGLVDGERMTELNQHLHVTFNQSVQQNISRPEFGLQMSTPLQSRLSSAVPAETPYQFKKISPINPYSCHGNTISPIGVRFSDHRLQSPYMYDSSVSPSSVDHFYDRNSDSSLGTTFSSTPSSSSSTSAFSPVYSAETSTKTISSMSSESLSRSGSCFKLTDDISERSYTDTRTVSIGTGNEDKIGHVISEATWRPW